MLKNYVERKHVEVVEFTVEFTDELGNGFSFPCNEFGELLPLNEYAQKNYDNAMQHPECFSVFNELNRRTRHHWEPATGTCRCGEHIELYDQYMGACECPNCGQWYNMYGQELLPPQQWEA